MTILRRPLVLTAAGLLVLLAGLAAVPFLIPTDVYRTQIETAASDALGREVTLDEDVSLSLLPRLSARVGGVEIANPDGFSRPAMLTAGEIRGVVRLLPLLSGRVEISEFVFADADLRLERLASGEVNWDFSQPAPSPESGPEPTTAPDPTGAPGAPPPAATVDTARLTNATVSYADAVSGASYTVSDLDIRAQMPAMDAPLEVEASGVYDNNPFNAAIRLASLAEWFAGQPAALDLTGDILGADFGFDGTVVNGGTAAVNGQFEAAAESLPPLLAVAGLDAGYDLAPLGQVRIRGGVSGPADQLRLSSLVVRTDSPQLESRYEGTVSLGDTIAIEGEAGLSAADLGALLTDLGVALPVGADPLQSVDVQLKLAGPLDALRLSDMELVHRGDLLSARFAGAVDLAGPGAIEGALTASSDALRALSEALGTPLPEGDGLQSFALSADLAGSFTKIAASELEATLDETEARGTASLDLGGARPRIVADLVIPDLPLDAFLVEGGEAEPAGATGGGWSDAAIDLAGLEMVDVDLRLRSERISIGDIVMRNADLDATIDQGRLDATIREAGLFGGQWSGAIGLDGSAAVPAATIRLDGTAVAIDEALATLAGLDAIGGLGQVSLALDTRGASIADMVAGLTGLVGADLADGRIKGLNIAQLVRSRKNIVEALADGSLQLALSPEAETDFTAFDTAIRFDKGIGQVESLSFRNPLVLFDGSGRLDLPARKLDLSLLPKVDETAGGEGTRMLGVDGIPIPIRLSGSWFAPKITPDTRLLQQQLQQSALDAVREEAVGQLGGEAGAVLDSLFGSGATGSAGETSGTGSTTGQSGQTGTSGETGDEAAEPAPEPSVEDAVEGLVRSQLGGLFGGSGNVSEPDTDTGTEPDER